MMKKHFSIFLLFFFLSSFGQPVAHCSFHAGQGLFFDSKYQEAATVFEGLLAKGSDDPRVREYLVKCYLKLADSSLKKGDNEIAVNYSKKATDLDPNDLNAWIALIELHFNRDKAKEVRDAALLAIKANSREKHLMAKVYEFLSWAQLNTGDLDEAIKAAERARSLDYAANRFWKNIEDRRYTYAEQLEMQGDEAIEKRDPTVADARYKKALLYVAQTGRSRLLEKQKRAAAQLEELKKQNAFNDYLKQHLALSKEGRWEEALNELEMARSINETNQVKEYIKKAEKEVARIRNERKLKSEEDRKQEQIVYFTDVMNRYIQIADWYKARSASDSLQALGVPDSKLKATRAIIEERIRVLELRPKAETAIKVGDDRGAALLLDEYIKNYPEDLSVLTMAARAWMNSGNDNKAIEYFRQAIGAEVAEPEDIKTVAELSIKSGELETGIRLFEQINHRNPGDLDAGARLTNLYLEAGNKGAAKSVLLGLREHINPAFAAQIGYYKLLGDLSTQEGQHRRAFEYYVSHISFSGNLADAYASVLISLFNFIGIYLLYFIVDIIAVSSYIRWYFREAY